MLFFSSVTLFVLALSGFIINLCGWVYNDAKNRNEPALKWMLIVLLVPNLFGILIYFIIGRKNKLEKTTNKFKVPLKIFIVIFIIASSFLFGTFINDNDIPIVNGISIGMVNSNVGSKWNVSFKTSGDEISRTINLNKNQLNNFSIKSNSKSGEVYLLIIQNENSKVINISNHTESNVDLSEFSTGDLRLTIYNQEAREANIKIDW